MKIITIHTPQDSPSQNHMDWAKEMIGSYQALEKFTIKQLAVAWGFYSRESYAAGWMTPARPMVTDFLKMFDVDKDGNIVIDYDKLGEEVEDLK